MRTAQEGARGFGYWRGMPPGTLAAWGARAIYTDGYLDIPWDRRGSFGDEPHLGPLCRRLDAERALTAVRKRVRQLWLDGLLPQNDRQEHTLYRKAGLRVVGNANGSYGYLYLVAFEEPVTEGATDDPGQSPPTS